MFPSSLTHFHYKTQCFQSPTCWWVVSLWSGWCSAPGCCLAVLQTCWSLGHWRSSSSCENSRRWGREVRKRWRKNRKPASPESPPCSWPHTSSHPQTHGSEEHGWGVIGWQRKRFKIRHLININTFYHIKTIDNMWLWQLLVVVPTQWLTTEINSRTIYIYNSIYLKTT